MTVEMTPKEVEILITVIAFTEGAALTTSPQMAPALETLRPLRAVLMVRHMRERARQAQAMKEEA